MKKCKKCFKSFVVTTDRTVFCSHKCQAQWAIKLANKIRKPKKRKGIILRCECCKKEFYVPNYRANQAKYCSRNCLAKIHLSKFTDFKFKKLGKECHKYKTITVNGRQIREHRYIMQQYIGRKLEKWEHVHHIDGNSMNNKITNLIILSNSAHQKEEHLFRKRFLLLAFLRQLSGRTQSNSNCLARILYYRTFFGRRM